MNLIELTSRDDAMNITINADRIDAMTNNGDFTRIFIGGSDFPFTVKESIDEIKSRCEWEHSVTKYIGRKEDSGPRLNIDEMY